MIRKIAKIDRYNCELLAYVIGRLQSIEERNGTLLDNTMLVYGSGIADANRHTHHDLPVLLAGRGGGALLPGRHQRYPDGTPLMNLYLSMLEIAGVAVEELGDSSGPLAHLG